jgi:hypothetical protein
MAGKNCERCAFRRKYDNDPRSLLGRIWRWHTGWWPGWNTYMHSLDDKERTGLARKYNMGTNLRHPNRGRSTRIG